MLGELSSALLSSGLPSHTDTWSISSSSTPLDDLKLSCLSFDRAGAADQKQTWHLPRAGSCCCHLLTQNASRTGLAPFGHQQPGPSVPSAGRQGEVSSDSDSQPEVPGADSNPGAGELGDITRGNASAHGWCFQH